MAIYDGHSPEEIEQIEAQRQREVEEAQRAEAQRASEQLAAQLAPTASLLFNTASEFTKDGDSLLTAMAMAIRAQQAAALATRRLPYALGLFGIGVATSPWGLTSIKEVGWPAMFAGALWTGLELADRNLARTNWNAAYAHATATANDNTKPLDDPSLAEDAAERPFRTLSQIFFKNSLPADITEDQARTALEAGIEGRLKQTGASRRLGLASIAFAGAVGVVVATEGTLDTVGWVASGGAAIWFGVEAYLRAKGMGMQKSALKALAPAAPR